MKLCLHLAGALFAATALAQSPALPVRDGLVLYLEASAQAALRHAAALPPIGHLQPADILLDGSPSALKALQPVTERRPVLISDDSAAYLKFDGQDDFAIFAGPPEPVPALTLFILAAPTANAGGFSALFASAALGRNDYTSGLNFDFGPSGSAELSVLNAESAGAAGFRDLLVPGFFNATERPFKEFHLFTVRSQPGQPGTEVFLDGFKGGDRERSASVIHMDQLVIGARLYSNDPSFPPFAQGFFEGAIADVILYNRALSDAELRAVEEHLREKIVALNALLHGAKGHALEMVKDPPVVQMLVPGFTVHELPLELGNLNNVRYRHDGKLVGLGYDGRIYLLEDTDGDGLEDKASFFWENRTLRGPIGMALTHDARGDGVLVASKGKISFFLDRDRDGRADEEIIAATGWPESFHSVDTLGLAVDPKDGSIYFGLGCANFADGYLIDQTTGRSRYSLDSSHGTIQRLAPDFSKHETVCTGVRFTCALAFNRQGDLFATDQEGATWLPNGNPLDELLHIQPGKHYGFPPRHPRHLPQVRDEPAVIEFAPQHQSTVGMVFNEGVNGGPSFGPPHWEGDALICGQARGKIWRTKLAKTPLGYVAQNHLLACLSLLTVDACVSPDGSLLVACHSGPPDWGTGPAGQGRLFKIRFTDRSVPQPVLAWAAAPDEFRIAFDRPLDPADWAGAKEHIAIEAGHHVSAGDRFEVMRPGYQVVRDQMAVPRRWVELLSLTLTSDRRALALRVPRQTEPVNYAITLPRPARWNQQGGIPQHPHIDILATLHGLVASLETSDGLETRSALPHPSLDASAIFTAGSAEHEAFLRSAAAPDAVLAFRGLVDLSNPFVPAVQPGSTLDWDLASDPFASATFNLYSDDLAEIAVERSSPNRYAILPTAAVAGSGRTTNANGMFLGREDLRHPVSTSRLWLPWAVETPATSQGQSLAGTREDLTGHWLRGRRLFFTEAGCATCHTLRGEGIAFGPDLSNLIHRDRDSVLQDILYPSAAINPDQTGTALTFHDGIVLSGILRSLSDDKLVLGLPAGEIVEFPRNLISKIEPLRESLMPATFAGSLTPDQLEDLLAFLLTNPLEPAPISRSDPPLPPARHLDEVIRVLGSAPVPPPDDSPALRILLCAGPKDHGPDEHDYPLWLDRWSRLLALGDNLTVDTAPGFPATDQLAAADVVVFYNANPEWNLEKAAALDEFHQRGGGAVYIHYAVDGGRAPDAAAERAGLAFTLGSRFRHGEFDLVFTRPDHPITRGFPTLRFTDETYWNMRGDLSKLDILATAMEDAAPRPELWTLERQAARIVACIPGHYTWTFDDPLFRLLVFRAICWAAKLDNVDRLAELTLIGARLSATE